MSKQNPRKAIAALIPPAQSVIRPMTLGMYAALERIGSPLVTGVEAKDTVELLPSLYLLTHDPREVFKGNVLDLAMQWADTVPVSKMSEIRSACEAQLKAVFDVIPETDPKKARSAATTDGLPRSSTTSPAGTTGPIARSSGKSRSPRSRSSDARSTSNSRSKKSSRSQKSRK